MSFKVPVSCPLNFLLVVVTIIVAIKIVGYQLDFEQKNLRFTLAFQ